MLTALRTKCSFSSNLLPFKTFTETRMKNRSGTTSYAHEIARKAWEDMRKSKRRDEFSNMSNLQSQLQGPRLSAAEAALALRCRMEQRKRIKESQFHSSEISPELDFDAPEINPHTSSTSMFSVNSKGRAPEGASSSGPRLCPRAGRGRLGSLGLGSRRRRLPTRKIMCPRHPGPLAPAQASPRL